MRRLAGVARTPWGMNSAVYRTASSMQQAATQLQKATVCTPQRNHKLSSSSLFSNILGLQFLGVQSCRHVLKLPVSIKPHAPPELNRESGSGGHRGNDSGIASVEQHCTEFEKSRRNRAISRNNRYKGGWPAVA